MAHHFRENIWWIFFPKASYYFNYANHHVTPLISVLYKFHGHTWYLKIEKDAFFFGQRWKSSFKTWCKCKLPRRLLKIGVSTCHLVKLWRPHTSFGPPNSGLVKDTPLFPGKSSLVKYYNLDTHVISESPLRIQLSLSWNNENKSCSGRSNDVWRLSVLARFWIESDRIF